jgi:glutamate racemase
VNNVDNRPIGIFDSGIGGLTVLKSIHYLMPNETLIYFGDLARIPYGTKSKIAILEYSLQTVTFLIKQNVKMIVIACNTIASTVGEEIAIICKTHNILLVNIIDCVINDYHFQDEKKKSNWLVLATPATINSGYYQKVLQEMPSVEHVYAQPCELFVPIIEEGTLLYDANDLRNEEGRKIIESIVLHYLSSFMNSNIDNIILGCTHYPIIGDIITDVIKQNLYRNSLPNIIDPADAVAKHVKELLRQHSLTSSHDLLLQKKKIKFYVTDSQARFIKIANIFLNDSYQISPDLVELIS